MDAELHHLLRQRLAERESLLRAEIREHRERLLEADAADNNSFIAGNEGAMADASDTLEIARLAHAQHELDLVVQALLRLDAGRYGACQRCGRPVGEARLRASPEARLCLACQQLVDGARAGR
jgi:DnaK suppressor protein